MNKDSKYVISACGLTKNFPKLKRYREMLLHPFKKEEVVALRGVDLKIAEGELFGLLGQNGAGKTTLIKILCTLMLPNEGDASINGYDIFKHARQIRRSIGYVVSEERSFFWRLNGKQNLNFFAALNNLNSVDTKKRVKQVLEITGLTADAERTFKDYSTGMRQRLAIARGLLTDPKILFMDEPTRSLDPVSAQSLRDFIINDLITHREKTVFFSTHNLSEAKICQRIAILHQGKIKICGTVGQILGIAQKKRYLIKLHQNGFDYNEVISSLSFVKGIKPITKDLNSAYLHLEINIDKQQGDIWRLIEKIVSAGGKLEGCHPLEVSLQEVFSQMTMEQG